MIKKEYFKTKPACKVTFTLEKSALKGGKEVRVLGDFNEWKWENGLAMKADDDAYTATVELPAGRPYEFRYLIDNVTWENDQSADTYVSTPYYGIQNSVVILDVPAVEVKPATKKSTAKKTTKKKKKASVASAPKVKAAKKDDLKKIEGIGPKIAGLLKEAGIATFKDLSSAKVKTLQEVLDNAGSRFKMHDPSTWNEQAKLAANGDWDELNKLQEELKGGRRKK